MERSLCKIGIILILASGILSTLSSAGTVSRLRSSHHGNHHGTSGGVEDVDDRPEIIGCSERGQPVYEKNPQDCSTYFVCSGQFYLLLHCPEGLHYNSRSFQCDYRENARCKVASRYTQKTSFYDY